MDKNNWLTTLERHRAIAIIRAPSLKLGLSMAQAVALGGFRLIEVTWNSERPAELIHRLRQVLPKECQIGAGTLLSPRSMKEAVTAGAQFCFTPHADTELIQLAQSLGIPSIPGALTPTEIVFAWESGASSVKVFPSQAVGGAAYIQHLQGPLGHIPLIPTGGVTLENSQAFLSAGAIAVGMSSSLFPKPLVKNQAWTDIQQRSHAFLQTLQFEHSKIEN